MRCLALADELRRRSAEVIFICRAHVGNLCELISDQGFQIACLAERCDGGAPRSANSLQPSPSNESEGIPAQTAVSWRDGSEDAEQTANVIRRRGDVDWLVVDHYALDARWESALRPVTRRIMVIDDLADRAHDCDLLLDQNLYPDMENRYRRLVPEGCRLYVGPRFALLRAEFAGAACVPRARSDVVRRVLVCFGGVDVGNATLKALLALEATGCVGFRVDVVIGATNPHRGELERYCDLRPQLRIHVQPGNLAQLMSAADLAIGGGGVTTWERCAVGLPAIVWPIARNQRDVIDAAAEYGALHAPEPSAVESVDQLSRHIAALLGSPALRRLISTRAASLCDGRGTRRIADALIPAAVRLRPAGSEDCEAIFQLRNDPNTRCVSHDPEPIPYERHCVWFHESLRNRARILLIAEQEGAKIGVLRYDIEETVALLSIYLAPWLHGRGLGSGMLQAGETWMREHHGDVKLFRAVVLERNTRSKALFEGDGFLRKQSVYEKALKP
jgi:UDP-2,4-diacetamido-2,4,6-trideoxy-beta-L-altropyranose hydrolase